MREDFEKWTPRCATFGGVGRGGQRERRQNDLQSKKGTLVGREDIPTGNPSAKTSFSRKRTRNRKANQFCRALDEKESKETKKGIRRAGMGMTFRSGPNRRILGKSSRRRGAKQVSQGGRERGSQEKRKKGRTP